MYDVITLGETMYRLTPPSFQRVAQATQFNIEIGGSESNTAVGLAQLGMTVAWLSRLTDNALGRRITQTLQGYDVDTSHVVWTDADRVGLYFMEEGQPPRPTQVTYDRAGSAISRMTVADLPQPLFTAGQARLLHLTGITAALSESAHQVVHQAMVWGKAAGWKISFDINYRAKLWSPQAAVAGCEALAQLADVILLPLRDAQLLYAAPSDPVACLDYLHGRWPHARLILTLGADGAMALDHNGQHIQQAAFPATPIGRIGGGDAFTAGFLYALLTDPDDLQTALRWGAAMAALKYTLPGDLPIVRRDDVLALLGQGNDGGSVHR
ncbi:MAG: PfkB family carbohydrate kinase [Phototrophicaceae bacterium]|jgi:2-dehydro-3-deoxygluconokinase